MRPSPLRFADLHRIDVVQIISDLSKRPAYISPPRKDTKTMTAKVPEKIHQLLDIGRARVLYYIAVKAWTIAGSPIWETRG